MLSSNKVSSLTVLTDDSNHSELAVLTFDNNVRESFNEVSNVADVCAIMASVSPSREEDPEDSPTFFLRKYLFTTSGLYVNKVFYVLYVNKMFT